MQVSLLFVTLTPKDRESLGNTLGITIGSTEEEEEGEGDEGTTATF